MSHFTLKSLSFYGAAIGSVALLFQVVSAYGERNLKAPPPVGGRYEIPFDSAECNSDKLVLTIHQSGIYLHGSLLSANRSEEIGRVEEKPELGGKWEGQNLVLAGVVEESKLCNTTNKNKRYNLTIIGAIKEDNLKGKMTVSGLKNPIEFTAKREERKLEKTPNH